MSPSPLLLLVAAASSPPLSIEGILLSQGLSGVVILGLGLYANATIKAGRERERRLEDDNRRLYQLMAEQFMPALTKATDAVTGYTVLMTEMKKREEISAAVEASRKARHEA